MFNKTKVNEKENAGRSRLGNTAAQNSFNDNRTRYLRNLQQWTQTWIHGG